MTTCFEDNLVTLLCLSAFSHRPQRPQVAELPITRTQDLVPMMMDPFGQAGMAAMAMQTGTFDAGVCSSAGSMGKGAVLAICQCIVIPGQ